DADRTEQRIIAQVCARREAPVAKVRHCAGGQRAAVEKGNHSEIAAELAEADARLERELGEAAAADRVALHVLGAELLIAVAAHRSPAARVESPRGSEVEIV